MLMGVIGKAVGGGPPSPANLVLHLKADSVGLSDPVALWPCEVSAAEAVAGEAPKLVAAAQNGLPGIQFISGEVDADGITVIAADGGVGANELTVDGPVFTADHVGATIVINDLSFTTTIATVVDATTATLTDPPGAPGTGSAITLTVPVHYLNITGFTPPGTAAEMMVVMKSVGDTTSTAPWLLGAGAGPYHPAGDGNLYEDFGSTARLESMVPPTGPSVAHVFGAASSASVHKAFYNGSLLGGGAQGGTYGFPGTLRLGKNQLEDGFSGYLFELKMWDRVLTDDERADELAALQTKWGL